jgi:hypothetical protein
MKPNWCKTHRMRELARQYSQVPTVEDESKLSLELEALKVEEK